MTAVALERVSRDFAGPDGSPYRALEDVSLEIAAGAFVAIVGPSGCGKSTLLNIAAGLVAPTTGLVRVAGETLAGLNRQAAYMFQHDALLPWKSVRDNVAVGAMFGARGKERSARQARQRAEEVLEKVGLGHRAPDLASDLTEPTSGCAVSASPRSRRTIRRN